MQRSPWLLINSGFRISSRHGARFVRNDGFLFVVGQPLVPVCLKGGTRWINILASLGPGSNSGLVQWISVTDIYLVVSAISCFYFFVITQCKRLCCAFGCHLCSNRDTFPLTLELYSRFPNFDIRYFLFDIHHSLFGPASLITHHTSLL